MKGVINSMKNNRLHRWLEKEMIKDKNNIKTKKRNIGPWIEIIIKQAEQMINLT